MYSIIRKLLKSEPRLFRGEPTPVGLLFYLRREPFLRSRVLSTCFHWYWLLRLAQY